MKKLLILSMAAFLIFGFTSWASADLTIDDPAYVQFYSVDDSGDSNASIFITDINLLNGMLLWYKVGGGAWTSYTSQLINVGTTENGGRTLVSLGIGSDVNNLIYSALSMQFLGENSNLPNHFDSLIINWTDTLYTKVDFVGNANGVDNLSPVPLPGAVWLLGAGLIGLVGVRRKFRS